MQTLSKVLSIPNGGTDTPAYAEPRLIGAAAAITVVAPAALTGVCTIQIDDGSGNFRTAQSPPGTDIALAAGKAVVLPPAAMTNFRIHSAGAEAAQRDFTVYIQSYR
jgi:hypothetical protein